MQKSINTLTVKGQKEEADTDNCLHILIICNNINNNVMYTTENNGYNNYYSIMCVHTHKHIHIMCVLYVLRAVIPPAYLCIACLSIRYNRYFQRVQFKRHDFLLASRLITVRRKQNSNNNNNHNNNKTDQIKKRNCKK